MFKGIPLFPKHDWTDSPQNITKSHAMLTNKKQKTKYIYIYAGKLTSDLRNVQDFLWIRFKGSRYVWQVYFLTVTNSNSQLKAVEF